MTIAPHVAMLMASVLLATASAEPAAGRWARPTVDAPTPDASGPENRQPDPGIAGRAVVRSAAELLVDASGVLTPHAAAERTEFLRHHAEESRIDLRVTVFGAAEVVPDDLQIEETFAGSMDAIAIYFIGEPERARLYFPGSLAAEVSEAEQRRALRSSVMQAIAKEDSDAQLDAFLTQLSIRLYWMEQGMGRGQAATTPVIGAPSDDVVAERRGADAIRMPPAVLPWLLGGGGIGIVLGCAWWLGKSRGKCRFPDFETEPRLGGPHGAGVGAVISYLTANLPPAEQRMQNHSFGDNPRH